jgi:hypothetical protein
MDEINKDLHFPSAGIDLSQAFAAQPNRPVATAQYPQQSSTGTVSSQFAPNSPVYSSQYARTTPYALNVRGFEAATQRLRGGSRPGLSKWLPQQVVGSRFIVQDLNVIVINNPTTPAGNVVQPSQSGRVVSLVAVGQGNVYSMAPGDTSWTPATNAAPTSPPLNFSGVVLSAVNNQKLWYADGVHWRYFDPTDGANGTVGVWAPNTVDLEGNTIPKGGNVLPVDSQGNTPRLIETWRGRTLLSGLLLDPQNIFFSAIGDPTNFDYSPLSPSPSQAVALNASPLGKVGDVVTGMCPYTDDVLIIFCDHTLWVMNGDPMAGGQLDLVSNAIGGVWGRCWEMDPYGNVYFVSNRTGIYQFVPGQTPQRISQPIEQLVNVIDTGTNAIRLLWDDRFQGLHVFISNLISPTVSQHLFYELRTGAWYQDQFGSPLFNPICCVKMDGNDPSDRVPLIGSWDGYVRACDPLATTDDGIAFTSEVVIGPLLTPNMDDMTLYELQAVLGETSGPVQCSILVGATAEAALQSEPVESELWEQGRNFTEHIHEAGHAIYVVITSSNQWTMEAIRMRLGTRGKIRQRRRK